jgi:tetratricopeptide (TPR) repeat protein
MVSIQNIALSLMLGWFAVAGGYDDAVNAFQQGRFAQVIALLEALPAPQAQRPAAQNLKALALCELKRFDEALESSQQACKGEPSNVNYLYNAGLIHIARKDYRTAERLYREGLIRFPESSKLHEGLGDSLFQLYQFPEAEKSIRRALELEPSSASAYVALAKLFHAVGHREQLGHTASRAVELDAESYLANYYYGLWLAEHQKDVVRAARHFEKASQLYPGFAPAWAALARTHAAQQRWTDAAAAYEQALALDSQNREVFYQAATAFRKVGQKEKAEWAMKRFKQLEARSVSPSLPK